MDKDLNPEVSRWFGRSGPCATARDKLTVMMMQGCAQEDCERSGCRQGQGHQPAARVAPMASRKSLQYLAYEMGIVVGAGAPQLPGYLAQALEGLATSSAVGQMDLQLAGRVGLQLTLHERRQGLFVWALH